MLTASMASTEARETVLLLKAPRDSDDDPYVETLAQAGYRAVVVAVLSFNFVNQGSLASALGNASNYAGIIFTSIRAVQAVKIALTSHVSPGGHFQAHSLRCFVVGQTTASAAREAHFQPEGEDTGNAEKLAEFIVDEVSEEEKRPFLYPCAQMRRDTLLDALTSNGYNVEEVIAYETVPNTGMKEAITDAFSTEDPPGSVVYFSPSGVQFTESLVQEGVLPLRSMKVYALGPTTEQALVSRHVPIAGVAAKPDPTSLLHMLQQR